MSLRTPGTILAYSIGEREWLVSLPLRTAPVASAGLLRRRPDLHALLCQPIPRSRFGEEAGGQHIVYDLPVFGVRDGKLTSHFSLTYIEYAQMVPGVRKLTAAEHEAIQLLLKVAEELCFEMRFAPGDMQLLNNHIVYHARTAFKDDARAGHDRLLMRLWLSSPNSRALPEDHAVLWGDIGARAASRRHRAAGHGGPWMRRWPPRRRGWLRGCF